MYKRGYEIDAELDAYGGFFDPKDLRFPDLDTSKADFYFDKGIECYKECDLNGSIINWSLTLTINPKDPNSYYSRAIVKNVLYTWKSALPDYDNEISLTALETLSGIIVSLLG